MLKFDMERMEFEILENFCSRLKFNDLVKLRRYVFLRANALFSLPTFLNIKCWMACSQCSSARISYFTSNNNVAPSLLNKI
jgi:hypothetical protein